MELRMKRKIPEHIEAAICCGPLPNIRDWRSLPVSQLTRAERMMKFCELYIKVPEGKKTGQPIKFEIFQEAFFYSVFDNKHGTRRAILSQGRKGGKTAIIACILIAYICGPEAKLNQSYVSGALSRDQAALVFNLACKMIQLSPELSKATRIIPSSKKIIGLAKNTEYKALAADGKTAHGLSPVLAILDESGQVRGPQSDFIDSIVTSQGAHEEPMLMIISTQAPNDNDWLSIAIDDAIESKELTTVCHLYQAPKDCDLMDKKAWQYANPALGIFRSEEDVREQAERAARMPSAEPTFRVLTLNQRVEMSSPFVARGVWQSNGGEIEDEAFKLGDVYAGLDLSSKNDLTSLVLIAKYEGLWHVRPYFWTPKDTVLDRSKRDRAPYNVWVEQGLITALPGVSLNYDDLARDICDIVSDVNIKSIAYDRWRFDILKAAFERIGVELPVVPYGQGYQSMSPAVEALETALLNKEVRHGNNAPLTMCIANTRIEQDPSGNRKLNKAKSTGRIDGAVAMAMAFGVAAKEQQEETPEFQMFVM
jgi:phage terminase large subunit-like protein